MKNMCVILFPFLLLLPLYFSGDQADWELKKDEDGIKVYTRYAENSNLKEVKTVNVVQSSLSGIVALLLDVKNYPNWIYSCSEASTLKTINDHEEYHYQVTRVPWPLQNRDMIWHFNIQQDTATGIVTITNTSEPEFVPEKNGIVRVRRVQSSYKLTPSGTGNVNVEFEIFVDPGGSVPAWLINANIITAPYKTTIAMVKQLPHYQKATFSFIIEK
jgi:hypothetical protein